MYKHGDPKTIWLPVNLFGVSLPVSGKIVMGLFISFISKQKIQVSERHL